MIEMVVVTLKLTGSNDNESEQFGSNRNCDNTVDNVDNRNCDRNNDSNDKGS